MTLHKKSKSDSLTYARNHHKFQIFPGALRSLPTCEFLSKAHSSCNMFLQTVISTSDQVILQDKYFQWSECKRKIGTAS